MKSTWSFMVMLHLILQPAPNMGVVVIDVSPTQLVSAVGGTAVFRCPSPTDAIVDIQWMLNGRPSDEIVAGSSVSVTPTFSEVTRIGTLRLANLSMDFNGTVIQCMAEFDSEPPVVSPEATLLIQGLLTAVGSLELTVQDSIISLTWLPPFTLDITSEDHDIRGYCVDVFNSTSKLLIYSESGISATLFQYPTPADSVCHNYMFTVTPVNVVGDGTSSIISYSEVETSPEVDEFNLLQGAEYGIIMTAPVCNYELLLLDLDIQMLFEIKLLRTDLLLFSLNAELLAMNHHYSVIIDASNAAGSTVSPPFTISTHDIMNVTATGNADEFIVTVTFFENSNAKGALFNFAYLNDKGDLSFYLLPLSRSDSMEYNILNFSLFESLIRISVYDIESDGVLFSDGAGDDVHVSYPADTMEETGTQSTTILPEQDGASCTLSSDFLTLLCTDSNLLISGIQIIIQSSDLEEREKLYVSERFDIDTMAEITPPIRDLISGTYQLTAFGIGLDTGMIDSVVYTDRVMVQTTSAPTDIPSMGRGTSSIMEIIMCCVLMAVLSSKNDFF